MFILISLADNTRIHRDLIKDTVYQGYLHCAFPARIALLDLFSTMLVFVIDFKKELCRRALVGVSQCTFETKIIIISSLPPCQLAVVSFLTWIPLRYLGFRREWVVVCMLGGWGYSGFPWLGKRFGSTAGLMCPARKGHV